MLAEAGWITIGPHQEGEAQMALDRSMAEATARDGAARVRFYEFRPPCLSLGYHQNRGDVDLEAVRRHGDTVAIRPTGGRAVLHKGDFVYSVSSPSTGLAPGASLHTGVYNLVSLALTIGLRKLGLEPDDAARHLDTADDSDLPRLCFSASTRHEIVVHGRKLVGSAQRVMRGAVLQHGSLLVTREHLEVTDLLAGLDNERRRRTRVALERRTVCLRDLGFSRGFEELAEVFSKSFGEIFAPLKSVGVEQFERSLQVVLEGSALSDPPAINSSAR